jgi:hypothetical protein
MSLDSLVSITIMLWTGRPRSRGSIQPKKVYILWDQKGSLPHSQQPVTGPFYKEPDEYTSHIFTGFLYVPFYLWRSI